MYAYIYIYISISLSLSLSLSLCLSLSLSLTLSPLSVRRPTHTCAVHLKNAHAASFELGVIASRW